MFILVTTTGFQTAWTAAEARDEVIAQYLLELRGWQRVCRRVGGWISLEQGGTPLGYL
jgi:hypothetical protein